MMDESPGCGSYVEIVIMMFAFFVMLSILVILVGIATAIQ